MEIIYDNHKVSFVSNFTNSNIELFIYQIAKYIENHITFVENYDIKNILVEELVNLNIKCYSRNIKLIDMQTQNEIKTINDIIDNKTKLCKIIIIPIKCNEHNEHN
jgi:hypothetical protein